MNHKILYQWLKPQTLRMFTPSDRWPVRSLINAAIHHVWWSWLPQKVTRKLGQLGNVTVTHETSWNGWFKPHGDWTSKNGCFGQQASCLPMKQSWMNSWTCTNKKVYYCNIFGMSNLVESSLQYCWVEGFLCGQHTTQLQVLQPPQR